MKLRKTLTFLCTLLFLLYSLLWLYLELFVSPESPIRGYYSLTYGIVAGFGGIVGLIVAKKWGGRKSYVGKSLIFFSLGLLFQFLGQNTYSIQYLIDGIENSYPSYGEIFFVSTIPSYILGVWYIAKASGSWESLKSAKVKLLSTVLPALMVITSYYFFVKGTMEEGQSLLISALNFTYPMGQAIFVSMAIMAYFLSNKFLGGIMKRRVIFILAALVFQYIADTVFLYKSIYGTFYMADFTEFLFAISYAIMTFSFLDFFKVSIQLQEGNQ